MSLLLRHEQGGDFNAAAGVETFVPFAFVVAVGGVGLEDVAVAGFQFSEDAGLVDDSGAAVVGECAEKDGIFAILRIEGAELFEVFA